MTDTGSKKPERRLWQLLAGIWAWPMDAWQNFKSEIRKLLAKIAPKLDPLFRTPWDWVRRWFPRDRTKRWLPALILASLVLWVSLGQLDTLLSGMTTGTAAPSGGVQALAKSGDKTTEIREVKTSISETWKTWHDPTRAETKDPRTDVVSPGNVLSAYVGLDMAFVLAYGALAAALLARLDRRIAPEWVKTDAKIQERHRRLTDELARSNQRRARVREEPSLADLEDDTIQTVKDTAAHWDRPLKTLAPALVVLLAADIIENALLLPAYGYDIPSWPLTWAYWIKVVSLGWLLAVGIYVLVVAPAAENNLLQITRRQAAGRRLRGLVTVRVSLFAVVLLGVALLTDVANQAADIIRRWDVRQLIITTYLALAMAFVIWLVTWSIAQKVDSSARPSLKERWLQGAGLFFVALGVFQIVWWWMARPEVGLGLVVPAAIVLVLAITGSGLPAWKSSEKRPRIIPDALPHSLAAAVVAIVGLGAIRAAIPDLIHRERELWPLLTLIPLGLILWAIVARVRFRFTWTSRGVQAVLYAATAGLLVLLLLPSAPQLATSWLIVVGVIIVVLAWAAQAFLDESRWILRRDGDHSFITELQAVMFNWREEEGSLRTLRSLLSLREGPRREFTGWGADGQILFTIAGLTLLALSFVIAKWPFTIGPRMGTVAVVITFLIGLLVVTYLLTLFAENVPSPRLLAHLGIRRLPVVSLLLVWVIAVGQIPELRAEGYHDVRIAATGDLAATVAAQPEVLPPGCDRWFKPNSNVRGITAEGAWERWLCTNGISPTDPSQATGAPRRVVPMFFVSAWGGGLRATAWTALVMDCVFEPLSFPVRAPGHRSEIAVPAECQRQGPFEPFEYSDKLFALSGISGGSVGYMQYLAHLSSKQAEIGAPERSSGPVSWVADAVSDDFVAPTISRLLFVDMPISLVGQVSAVDDRASILEQAWERSWKTEDGEDGLLTQGLFQLWHENAHIPVVVANGATVSGRCSFNTSVLDASIERARPDGQGFYDDCTSIEAFEANAVTPTQHLVATQDVGDFLCPGFDLRLSTAGLNSARFPVVSPTGRLTNDDCPEDAPQSVHIVDGGNLELSGTLTIFQLWDAVEPLVGAFNSNRSDMCIVPFMIHMENGYSPAEPQDLTPSSPNEWLVPGVNLRDGLVQNARARAALEFNEPLRTLDGTELIVRNENGEAIPDRYAFMTTRAHPGVEAPLGWTLSSRALDDLQGQLGASNGPALTEIATWFETLECATS